MKNNVLFLIKSKLSLNVKGNNIERFIKRLNNNNIDLLRIKYISPYEINIKIYKKDYDKVIKLKTIYEVEVIEYYGLIKTKNNILNNKFIIIFLFIGLISIYVLTSMIFKVDIITNDSKMEKILIDELKEYGIKKYNFKKDYLKLQEIKNNLLKKHRDELEWIEIESMGTKYIVRYEPRIKNNITKEVSFRNIVAKKDCVIKDLNISSGQIVKDIDSYVKKGEVIVSGYITLNDSIKDTVSSNGKVYGEVWYKVSITYPYKYKEVLETGNTRNVFAIKIFNKYIELFNFKKYKTKHTKDNSILNNNILPIKLIKQNQRETKVIEEDNTEEELIRKAIKYAKKKIEKNLKEKEYVKAYKVLNKTKHSDSVTLNIFFNVIEDVTEYVEIEEYKEDEEILKNS